MNIKMTRLADVQPEQITWLWPGRIPAGKLVTLDGDPGLGKSTLALTLAATVTRGGEWPDGTRCDVPGDVLLMSAEDGLADTVRPRLDAAGADVRRVHAIDGVPDGEDVRPIRLSDVDVIRQAIEQTGARLLIVDVLMAFLTGDAHKDQDVRRVLSPLARVADETGCTVLLLRHLNKAPGGDPLYRGGGSIGIVGAARAGLLVAADRADEDVRVLASVKNNLAPRSGSLRYRLTESGGSVRVEWIGVDDRTARELLSDGGDNFGDKSRDVLALVTREVTPSDIAEELGMANKLTGQYLARLADAGRIRKVRRGVYAPLSSPGEETEESEENAGRAPDSFLHSVLSLDIWLSTRV